VEDVARPEQAGVHEADDQQHGKPAQVHGGRTGWVALQHALELDREADAEQQREQAVELAGEQHVPQLLGPLVHGAVPQV
jgi:hypothetical protein